MEFNANRVDGANAVITATLTKDSIENNLENASFDKLRKIDVNRNVEDIFKDIVDVIIWLV